MKTRFSLFAAAALSGLVFAQSNSTSGPATVERQPLERWLGDWTYQTTVHDSPLGTAGTSLGSCSVQPLTNGKFVEFRGKETVPGEPLQQIEDDGMDPARGSFFWSSFAGDTAVINPAYTFDGTRVAMVGTLRTGKQSYKLRSLVTFSEDFQSLTDKREISTDGVHWRLLSESRAAKVIPVLAAPDTDADKRDAAENKCLPNSLPPK